MIDEGKDLGLDGEKDGVTEDGISWEIRSRKESQWRVHVSVAIEGEWIASVIVIPRDSKPMEELVSEIAGLLLCGGILKERE